MTREKLTFKDKLQVTALVLGLFGAVVLAGWVDKL